MCLTFLASPVFVSMPNYLPHLCQSALLVMCSSCAHNNSSYKLMILIAYHILETAVPNTLQNRLTIPYSLTPIYILFSFQFSLSLVFVLRVGNEKYVPFRAGHSESFSQNYDQLYGSTLSISHRKKKLLCIEA